MYIVFNILAFALFIFLGIIIHELGHLFFGFISGYSFVSFRVLHFLWQKEEGRVRFYTSKSPVLGQCLMEPMNGPKHSPFVLYNLGGGLFNLLTAAVLIFVHIFANLPHTGAVVYGGAAASIYLGIINLVPISRAINNDGMNVRLARASIDAQRGFYYTLKTNAQFAQGMRPRELDATVLYACDSADLTNDLVISLFILRASVYYDRELYPQAIAVYEGIDTRKLSSYYHSLIQTDYLLYYSLHHRDRERAKKIFSDITLQQFLHRMPLPSPLRAHAAYLFFIENKQAQGLLLLQEAEKVADAVPNKGLRTTELDYIEKARKQMEQATEQTH